MSKGLVVIQTREYLILKPTMGNEMDYYLCIVVTLIASK